MHSWFTVLYVWISQLLYFSWFDLWAISRLKSFNLFLLFVVIVIDSVILVITLLLQAGLIALTNTFEITFVLSIWMVRVFFFNTIDLHYEDAIQYGSE